MFLVALEFAGALRAFFDKLPLAVHPKQFSVLAEISLIHSDIVIDNFT